MNKTTITAEKGKQEIFIEREFEAPRELVFQAFTEAEYLVKWQCPNNMDMKIDYLDNRSGGSYRFVSWIIGQEKQQFCFNGVLHEVTAPERLIRTFEFEGLPERGHVSIEFLTLEELPGDRTKLKIQTVFKSVADRDGMVASGMESGMNEGFSKLDKMFEDRR